MRRLNCAMLATVPLEPVPRTVSIHSRSRSRPVIPLLAEVHARGHVQQRAERRGAIFGALQARHIGLRGVVDRFDRAVADRNLIRKPVIDFTIDCDNRRSRSVRPY